MAKLLKEIIADKPQYKDRRFPGTQEDWDRCLRDTSTVYVGNLSFCTREEQVYEVFAKAGCITRVIMGLHKELRTPCGFCFVEYRDRADAETAVSFINRTMLDNRVIRVDLDWGFVEGRQYGRGKSGGQVRDEYRQEYDPGRGGLGVQAQYEQGMKPDQGPGRGRKRGREFEEAPPPVPKRPVPPPAPPPSAPPPPPPPPPAAAEDAAEEDADMDDGGERPEFAEHSAKRARTGASRDSIAANEAAEVRDHEMDETEGGALAGGEGKPEPDADQGGGEGGAEGVAPEIRSHDIDVGGDEEEDDGDLF